MLLGVESSSIFNEAKSSQRISDELLVELLIKGLHVNEVDIDVVFSLVSVGHELVLVGPDSLPLKFVDEPSEEVLQGVVHHFPSPGLKELLVGEENFASVEHLKVCVFNNCAKPVGAFIAIIN